MKIDNVKNIINVTSITCAKLIMSTLGNYKKIGVVIAVSTSVLLLKLVLNWCCNSCVDIGITTKIGVELVL